MFKWIDTTPDEVKAYFTLCILSSRGQPTRSGPPAWGFGVRLTTSHCKNKGVQKRHTGHTNEPHTG